MVYLDNAATTFPKPECVYEFMDSFYRENGVNVGRGQHKMASIAHNLVSDTRERLLSLFHAPTKNVVFTHSATEALNIILQGIKLPDGAAIYISPFEHNAVTRILHHLKGIHNFRIVELTVDKATHQYNLEAIRYQFEDVQPNLLVASHASNVCGVIAPIYDLCTMAKSHGAITVIDMAQTAGLIDTDLSGDIYDFAVFAGHKTLYGPLGVAGFICGSLKPDPLHYGGTGMDSANPNLPDTIPERYEVGSPNIMAIAGLNAALKWLELTGLDVIAAKEKETHTKLVSVLASFPNIRIIAREVENTIGVVSCVFDGYASDSIGQVLSEQDIAVRTGLHCAPSAHAFLGTHPSGTVRFSISYFTREADLEALYKALQYIHENG